MGQSCSEILSRLQTSLRVRDQMPDTRTIRLNKIAEMLEEEGHYTMANSIFAVTIERDNLRQTLITINHIIQERLAAYNVNWIDEI